MNSYSTQKKYKVAWAYFILINYVFIQVIPIICEITPVQRNSFFCTFQPFSGGLINGV